MSLERVCLERPMRMRSTVESCAGRVNGSRRNKRNIGDDVRVIIVDVRVW